MDDFISFDIPVKTGAGLNDRLHWSKKAKSAKLERTVAFIIAKPHGASHKELPCHVKMIRKSSGKLDSDNLQGALKACRDGLADALGVKDNDERITWLYGQESCARGDFGVRVEIT